MGHAAPFHRAIRTPERRGGTVADGAVVTDGTVARLQVCATSRRDGLGSVHREPLSSRSHATLRAASAMPPPDRPRGGPIGLPGPPPPRGHHSQVFARSPALPECTDYGTDHTQWGGTR